MESREVPDPTPAHTEDPPQADPITNPTCDLCGKTMIEWHCRIVCTACGYQRDCSDP